MFFIMAFTDDIGSAISQRKRHLTMLITCPKCGVKRIGTTAMVGTPVWQPQV